MPYRSHGQIIIRTFSHHFHSSAAAWRKPTGRRWTGCTDPASQHNGHHTEPSGRATPTSSGGSPPASHMACIRQSYGSKGLLDRVVSIVQKSWRKSTESAYSSVWRRWSSWCDQQQVDPVSAPSKYGARLPYRVI